MHATLVGLFPGWNTSVNTNSDRTHNIRELLICSRSLFVIRHLLFSNYSSREHEGCLLTSFSKMTYLSKGRQNRVFMCVHHRDSTPKAEPPHAMSETTNWQDDNDRRWSGWGTKLDCVQRIQVCKEGQTLHNELRTAKTWIGWLKWRMNYLWSQWAQCGADPARWRGPELSDISSHGAGWTTPAAFRYTRHTRMFTHRPNGVSWKVTESGESLSCSFDPFS